MLVLVGGAVAWNKDGYPDCVDKFGPDCTPNRRASHHNSLLDKLFNKWCSDKGTYWLSKHNYGAAYDTVLRPIRRRARHLLELGVGDETAGSLNAWREYFPRAQFWIADIDVARFADKKQWAWASRQKRRHGCWDDPDIWTAPRVHTLFGVDSSNRTQLQSLPLPAEGMDVIIDDASHALAHQLIALEALWPRLKSGGFYIVEDLTIGALPWMRGSAGEDQVRRAPSNNSNCGHECHYVQRPSEHPFIKRLIPTIADQRAAAEALALGPALPRAIERILDTNAWFYSITGAHVGGGLDSAVIIQKTEAGTAAAEHNELPELMPPPPPPPPPTILGLTATTSYGNHAAAGPSARSSPYAASASMPQAAFDSGDAALPSWAASTTVARTGVPQAGSTIQFVALLVVVGGSFAYRQRIVGMWRRMMGRSSDAE